MNEWMSEQVNLISNDCISLYVFILILLLLLGVVLLFCYLNMLTKIIVKIFNTELCVLS